jgi:Domain of unknown function (DUF4347)/SdrD B-like domain/Bacterial Ig domain
MSNFAGNQQIVFIDSRVPDLQDLVEGVDPGTQVFVLDPSSDGIQQIADILAANNLDGLTSISIVGHGAAGQIDLGSTVLDDSDLSRHSAALAQIGAALAPGGTLQLYGCDVASGATGQQFIADLSHFAGGADVAAATHDIGLTASGENWTLDASTTAVATSTPFTAQAMASYQGRLANTFTATQSTVLTTDVDGDGVVDPGDTVTTTVTITNTSTNTDATGVSFDETLDRMTLVNGTLNVSPLAFNDSYNAIGNVVTTVNAANGVLANDHEFLGANISANPADTHIQTTGAIASTHGSVNLSADGSFTYTPNTGFTGTDTFTYTLVDAGGLTGQGTVTFTVGPEVWFIDKNAAAGGDGSEAHPFNSIAAFNTANTGAAGHPAAGDTIYLRAGTYNETDGIHLLNNQKLVGQGENLVVTPTGGGSPVTVETGSAGQTPIIHSSSGDGVHLASGNTIEGFNVDSTGGAGAGISDEGNNVGTLGISNIHVSTASGAGILLTHGGTVSVTGSGNTLSSTSGTALDIANTTIGAGNITFQSITAGSGSNSSATGIILDTTGSSGGLHVTGVGTTAGSGGTIQHKTGADGSTSTGIGIYLNSASNVQLADMQLNDFQNFGIYGNSVTGLSLSDSSVTGANGTVGGEGSVILNNLFGTNSVTRTTVSGGVEDNFRVQNDTGTLTALNVSNSSFLNNSTASLGNMGFAALARLTANMTVTVQDSTFQGNRTIALRGDGGDSATLNFNALNNTIIAGTGGNNQGNQGIEVDTANNAKVTFKVEGNKIGTPDGTTAAALLNTGINIFNGTLVTSGTPADISGTVKNNVVINDPAALPNSSNGFGIRLFNNGYGTMEANVDNNTVSGINTDYGIFVEVSSNSGQAASVGHTIVAVTNNTSNVNSSALDAIRLQARGRSILDARVENNHSNGGGTGFVGLEIRQAQQTIPSGGTVYQATFNLEGLTTGLQTDHATIVNYLHSKNPAITLANTDEIHSAGITGVPSISGVPPLLAAPGGVEPSSSNPIDTTTPLPDAGPVVPPTPAGDQGLLTQSQLNSVLNAAITRWEATGLTAAQDAYLHSVTVSIADLGGITLGAAAAGHIMIDDNAAGSGWYIDPTPQDNAEFPNAVSATELLTDPTLAPAGHVDLLTTVMHELGHELGLDDTYDLANRDSLMFGYIVDGERRLPAAGEADGATPGNIVGQDFALGPIAIGTLPANKSVTIQWQATADAQNNQLIVNPQNHGTVSVNSPFTATNTNTVTTTLDTLALGNLVFNDVNRNGVFDGGDSGINGVALTLFADTGTTVGSLDASDPQIATTTTAGGGLYSFTGLAPGSYIVRVDQTNFNPGGALHVLSIATTPVDTTPDDNIDNDNNGSQSAPGQLIVTKPITLAYNSEPTNGTGNDTNNTLDIGVFSSAPVVTTSGGATSTLEQTPAVIDSGLTVTDPDNATLPSATVAVTGNFQSGEDVLAFVNNNAASFGNIQVDSYTGGVLALSSPGATATLTQWQNALRAVTYDDSSDTPNTGNRTISFVANDGTSNSTAATKTVGVTAVNDPPVDHVPGAQTVNEDTALVFNSGNSNPITITDPDVGGGNETVTLSVNHGTLTLGSTWGLGFDSGTNGTGNFTFHGTLANVNAALNGLAYQGNPNFNGSDTLAITTNDNGNTPAPAQQDQDTVAITVSAVNDAPVVVNGTSVALIAVNERVAFGTRSAPAGPMRARC